MEPEGDGVISLDRELAEGGVRPEYKDFKDLGSLMASVERHARSGSGHVIFSGDNAASRCIAFHCSKCPVSFRIGIEAFKETEGHLPAADQVALSTSDNRSLWAKTVSNGEGCGLS